MFSPTPSQTTYHDNAFLAECHTFVILCSENLPCLLVLAKYCYTFLILSRKNLPCLLVLAECHTFLKHKLLWQTPSQTNLDNAFSSAECHTFVILCRNNLPCLLILAECHTFLILCRNNLPCLTQFRHSAILLWYLTTTTYHTSRLAGFQQ